MDRPLVIAAMLTVGSLMQPPALLGQEVTRGIDSSAAAENYLSSFKQRALDAAFDAGARVKGLAYIDDQGRLHERTMFSTEADVRGVQIESYLDAMGNEQLLDSVQVPEASRCQLWTGNEVESGLITIKLEPGFAREASDRSLRQKEEEILATMVQRTLLDSGFRALEPIGPKPDEYQDTTYARALVGDWSEGPAPDFAATVSVTLLADERQKRDLYINHPGIASIRYVRSSTARPANFAVSLSFSQPAARRLMGEFRIVVEADAYRAFESGEWVLDQDVDDLEEWVREAVDEFVAGTVCLPRVFSVQRDGPDLFSIDAGRSRGVTEGSWLLVGGRDLMVNNVISDMTLDTLWMLRVTRADDHRAQAEPLPAGEGVLVSQGELLGTLP